MLSSVENYQQYTEQDIKASAHLRKAGHVVSNEKGSKAY
jgi:hypothetical protein